MVTALSFAFNEDLREEFRALNFPISDEDYEALWQKGHGPLGLQPEPDAGQPRRPPGQDRRLHRPDGGDEGFDARGLFRARMTGPLEGV